MTTDAVETARPADPAAPAADPAAPPPDFHWTPQPEAERVVRGLVDDVLSRTPFAADLARRMAAETGTRFHDWVNHVTCPTSPGREKQLRDAGFVPHECYEGAQCFTHPGGLFPAVVLEAGKKRTDLYLRVESVADFAAANGLPLVTRQPPLGPVRRAFVDKGNGTDLWVIETRGNRGFAKPAWPDGKRVALLHHAERFRTRPREFDQDAKGFDRAAVLVRDAIKDVGADVACDVFFAAEREYWQRRNRAARVQKARQDRLGLGWANHDHHTYRSSRRHFARLVALFESMGFHCRERFYAGREAGWGAQVLEQPSAGIVIFADVDLSPDEVAVDFAHQPLPERDHLGTVGLWCELHGESLLEAGMHHLECQFDFDGLKRLMETESSIPVMKPFTDFPHLRQAFTAGERWPVRPGRVDKLLAAGRITPEQADKFRAEGAIGSHLENLERNAGFKGFNSKGVSEIITATDPRTHVSPAVPGNSAEKSE